MLLNTYQNSQIMALSPLNMIIHVVIENKVYTEKALEFIEEPIPKFLKDY